jgi:hypothetical protein
MHASARGVTRDFGPAAQRVLQAKHRIKISAQALDIRHMRGLAIRMCVGSGRGAPPLELLLVRHRRRAAQGQEMPTAQGFPASRILSTARFVMARLAETA